MAFRCEFCGKEFDNIRSLYSHYTHCKLYIKKEKRSKSIYKISDHLYRCECGREFDNPQSLNAHFRYCLIHKKLTGQEQIIVIKTPPKGIMQGWNKFTDEDKKRFAKTAGKTISKRIKNGELKGSFTGKTHSEETKEKMRKARVEYLSDGKQHGAFDKSKKTYLENWFDNFLIENDLYSKYNIKYNYSVYPYFLDFAFIDLKLDVEVDGSYHYIYEENIPRDQKRNKTLEDAGWRVFRISIDEVNKKPEEIKHEFLNYLNNFNQNSTSRYYKIPLK